MGWHCKEGRKEIVKVEDSIIISRRKTDPHIILDSLPTLLYLSLLPSPSKRTIFVFDNINYKHWKRKVLQRCMEQPDPLEGEISRFIQHVQQS